MKKLVFFALAAFAMISCNREIAEVESLPQSLKYEFQVCDKPSFDADTRATKTSWKEGDKIYIVFDDNLPHALSDFMILSYASGAWKVTQEAAVKPKSAGGTLDALYYDNPNPDGIYEDSVDGGEFLFERYLAAYGQYFYLLGEDIAYTVEGNTLSSHLALQFEPNNVRTYVQLRITGLEGDWKLFLQDFSNAQNGLVCPAPLWQTLNKCFVSYVSSTFTQPLAAREDGHYLYLSVYQPEESLTLTLLKERGEHAGYYQKTFPKRISGNVAAITFQGPQFGADGIPTNGWKAITRNVGGHLCVDMGGDILWAANNVGGESSIFSRGDYFAWGETSPYYSSLSPLTWKEGKSKGYDFSSHFLMYYSEEYASWMQNLYDNSVLKSEDDAATQNWGSAWRTPTHAEWKWLVQNCNIELLPDGSCYRVSSKVEGYEHCFILLPAAGTFEYTELDTTNFYMTSNYITEEYRPILLSLPKTFYYGVLFFGTQVRPVTPKP